VIYIGLTLVLPAFWFGFWWLLIPIAFAMGYTVKISGHGFALGSGIAWAALAFIRDGQNSHGAIAGRMAGMFSLPGAPAFYCLLIFLGYLTAILWFKAGGQARS
jgi:hypothetical protein